MPVDSASTESGTAAQMPARGQFPAGSYETQGLDQLVTYCVDRILQNGEECTFERLVYECFTLFPRKFGFARYPGWPDSARVNKSWLRCRTDRRWIAGSVQAGFVMTPAGSRVALEVASALRTGVLGTQPRHREPRERWEAAISRIKRHPAFLKFRNDSSVQLTQQEARNVLAATLETPLRILDANLSYFRQVASEYEDREVQGFLDACGKALGLHESRGARRTRAARGNRR